MTNSITVDFESFNISPVGVQCIVCGRFISKGTLDRNGPAFRAYMCDAECVLTYLRQHSNIPIAPEEDESYE